MLCNMELKWGGISKYMGLDKLFFFFFLKKRENPSLLSELYVYIGIYIKIGDLLSLSDTKQSFYFTLLCGCVGESGQLSSLFGFLYLCDT